jgi:hypothetical protein
MGSALVLADGGQGSSPLCASVSLSDSEVPVRIKCSQPCAVDCSGPPPFPFPLPPSQPIPRGEVWTSLSCDSQ